MPSTFNLVFSPDKKNQNSTKISYANLYKTLYKGELIYLNFEIEISGDLNDLL